ncbi:MAG: transposase [Pseudomonadota bacterium]
MRRKEYSPEFKPEAVERVRLSRTSCRQIVLEIGIKPDMLTRWVREANGPADKTFTGAGPQAIKNWLA